MNLKYGMTVAQVARVYGVFAIEVKRDEWAIRKSRLDLQRPSHGQVSGNLFVLGVSETDARGNPAAGIIVPKGPGPDKFNVVRLTGGQGLIGY